VEERLPAHIQALVIDDEWGTCEKRPSKSPREELAHREQDLDPDDPIDIQYTSGTTGFPKGATLSHHNILNNGYFVGRTLKYSENDRICIAVPLYHCFGQVHGQPGGHQPWRVYDLSGEVSTPAAVLATVEKERCTSLYGVPTMFIAELEHANFSRTDFASLRTGINGWLALPHRGDEARAERHAHARDHHLLRHDRNLAGVHAKQSRRSSGQARGHGGLRSPQPGGQDRGTGHRPRGSPRAPWASCVPAAYSVMLGYWDDLHPPGQAIDNARWMHTGDLATMDADGYVNIVGRIKDMVMRRGREHLPARSGGVPLHQAGGRGRAGHCVPDAKYGEELMPGSSCGRRQRDRRRAARFCKGKSRPTDPRYWKFVDTFPMTVTGKIRSTRCARWLWKS